MELSLREAIALGQKHIGSEHITLALLREGDGVAAQVIRAQGIDIASVRRAVAAAGSAAGKEPAGAATQTTVPRTSDRVTLTGLEVFARHGVEEHEKETGQIFLVDATLELDLGKAGQSDDLAETVNYAEVAQRVSDVVAGERWNLIERVAERVAAELLADSRVHEVTVTVHKPHAPMPVTLADLAVTIHRSRG
jgi:dihydroneopterin aldolase